MLIFSFNEIFQNNFQNQLLLKEQLTQSKNDYGNPLLRRQFFLHHVVHQHRSGDDFKLVSHLKGGGIEIGQGDIAQIVLGTQKEDKENYSMIIFK